MLSTRDRRCDRHSLLDVAEFLATRLKQMPMHGTAVDMRVREGTSQISRAEKELNDLVSDIEWKDLDVVIPACASPPSLRIRAMPHSLACGRRGDEAGWRRGQRRALQRAHPGR